jgi:hypothetical protein
MAGEEAAGRTALEDAVRTFALRIARKCFLQYWCSEDHPVLEVELCLVEMASSKLQEQLLIHYRRQELEALKVPLEAQIRLLARIRIGVWAEAEDVREDVLGALDREILNIFPSVH